MRIIDITLPLRADMPTWPGEPGPQITLLKSMAQGDPADVSMVSLGSHTGTHIDAPAHFLPGGATVEQLSLTALVGPALVVKVSSAGPISEKTLRELVPLGTGRLLVKANPRLWEEQGFREDFVALSAAAARWLGDIGLRLVGIDALSIEPYASPEPVVHRTLLGAGVVVVEGLDLRAVAPGRYTLACLPLKVVGAEGAPARAVLLQE